MHIAQRDVARFLPIFAFSAGTYQVDQLYIYPTLRAES